MCRPLIAAMAVESQLVASDGVIGSKTNLDVVDFVIRALASAVILEVVILLAHQMFEC